jgi:hypothetical protein
MLQTKAVFRRKETDIETANCVIEKVIRLPDAVFESFSLNLMREWDFIRDNKPDTSTNADGRRRCLLIVSDGRRDGILVNSEGADYAYYSAFMPNAEDFLTVGRYPALAELNQKLTAIVDAIAEQADAGNTDGRVEVDLTQWEELYDVFDNPNPVLIDTVLNMLGERPEIGNFELDKNELILYSEPTALTAEDLTDPSVSLIDMYAYGYGYIGMNPLGKERALELFEKGYQIYRLYENDAEGAVESRAEIETFDGMFGVENPEWVDAEQGAPLEVFILNREKNDKGEASGEWLTLPADADTLRGLFERIGVDRPSEGAFTVTAVRARDDSFRDYVSKYDSLDELNMLASYMKTAADYYEYDTFQAVLTSGIVKTGDGAAALINLLHTNNIECFELIDAKDAESLARYYDGENYEKPENISFEDYGKQCVREEGGRFTEWGYIKQKYNDFSQRYTGVVPEEYQITGMALHALRLSKPERDAGEKPSVMARIEAARKAPRQPRKDAPDKSKRKGGPEL